MSALARDGAQRRGACAEPLSPLGFLTRSAEVWAERVAVRDGARSWTYAEHLERVQRAAAFVREAARGRDGAPVATILPNVPAMLELHYAVPGAGGVLVPLNTRLGRTEYAYILRHSEAALLFAHEDLRAVVTDSLVELGPDAPAVVWVAADGAAHCEYEAALAGAAPSALAQPADENAWISINYTSGTTGSPKGVITTHRGAYLQTLGIIAEAVLRPDSVYLWTLPMFHCNGWAYTWAVTAVGARHLCLPAVEVGAVWRALRSDGVTHLCAAPTVLGMIVESEHAERCPQRVSLFVGGAPPAPALLERAAALDIEITHLYGLTETYGPVAICAWNPDWAELPVAERSALRARQGVRTITSAELAVVDEDLVPVARDGRTLGEVVVRGNTVMAGYHRDPQATECAFAGGWFHTGDLAVLHENGYMELRDRLKDIIISGGENISTIEVEQALMSHSAVAEAAVVARADPEWGEVPVAFVVLRAGARAQPDELREHVRARLARFKTPREVRFVAELPKTATGKIQKFELREALRAAGGA